MDSPPIPQEKIWIYLASKMFELHCILAQNTSDLPQRKYNKIVPLQ